MSLCNCSIRGLKHNRSSVLQSHRELRPHYVIWHCTSIKNASTFHSYFILYIYFICSMMKCCREQGSKHALKFKHLKEEAVQRTPGELHRTHKLISSMFPAHTTNLLASQRPNSNLTFSLNLAQHLPLGDVAYFRLHTPYSIMLRSGRVSPARPPSGLPRVMCTFICHI